MSKPALQTQALIKRYGGLLVTDSVSIDVREGELHAIIGPNGAGKTTLINQLSGNFGRMRAMLCMRVRKSLHYLFTIGLAEGCCVRIRSPPFSKSSQCSRTRCSAAMGAKSQPVLLLASYVGPGRSRQSCPSCARDHPAVASDRCIGSRAGLWRTSSIGASHGFAAKPRVLLLDEPMAGMSPQESTSVIELLKSLKGSHSILLIEHDMEAVFALADRITVLVYGKVLCTGTPDEIRNNPEVKTVYLGDEHIG
uniref:ATP-binding protein n=2 Tax=Pseudomonadota TaxID=1224 RepID=O87622_PSEAI|nr:ATP-binding protein [Pseudomonas aeruginosa]